jgi:hypothetical protein
VASGESTRGAGGAPAPYYPKTPLNQGRKIGKIRKIMKKIVKKE